MARKSIIEREKKKIKLVEKFSDKRAALKEEQRKAATFKKKWISKESFKSCQEVLTLQGWSVGVL
jgi:hypothetical protein